MSVYTELLRIGVAAETAREIADAVHAATRQDLATQRDMAEMETRVLREPGAQTRTFVTSVIAMTGIFAAFVSVMTWVIRR